MSSSKILVRHGLHNLPARHFELLAPPYFRSNAPRRQQQLPRQVQHFLSLPQAEVAVRAFQFHVLARLGFMVRMQQAIRQQLERTSQWRPFRRLRSSHVGAEDSGRSHHTAVTRTGRQAQRWMEQGMLHERELKLEDAVKCFEKAAQVDPTNAEHLARLSKALSDMSYIPGTPAERAMELNRRAIEVALQAVAANPLSSYGHVACCVSRGRLALFQDNRTKVQLAREAQDDVRKALELEPNNDVAHHLLGRWNYEMASVNAVVRTLIQMLYGTSLMAGSYREAALCFEAAVRIRPDFLIHRVELGRTYLKLGQLESAVRELETAMALDVPDINAVLQKEDAVLLLSKLKPSGSSSNSNRTPGR
ncbi:hypothetical protein VOLCADRAFT_97641 [Volvox carteri f. nagariensis]|uniref:Regulator of microtubule dynamics protein 1 n=1 Tax=Volvox carteri f. nagariensis TaxID=3068 RepID=D8UD90_VOLCA|nr:uncharacterized protein VOLCADRAFT_97641 [Volvox carteri f. nagariensis]EFJ42267.1 hypothetical protein VOLCADRAFT_97641 [Volvox carteri f. nagariensis]|eukprot:XP_002956665.1 hypothetical protein VOLCADRAFT_97641 [Volvox carteri f. nagariensis]